MLYRLSSNSLWLLIARIGTQLGMAVFTILVARSLGSAIFGEYAFVASVVFVGNVLTTFGTDMLLIRDIASTDDLSDLPSALVVQLLLSAAFIGIVFAASALFPSQDPGVIYSVRVYSLSLFPQAFFTVYSTALRGRQRMRAYSVLNLTSTVMQVLVALWLFWKDSSLIQLATLLFLVQAISAFIAGLACRIVLPTRIRFWPLAFARLLPLVRASAPIALFGLLGVIYQRFILLVLPGLAGAAAAGWFSAGARLIEAAKTLHVAILTALYPMMAEITAVDRERWFRAFRIPGLVLLGGGLLGSVTLYFLAAPLVPLLFGSEYIASISVVHILTWILVPYAINSFLMLAFLARGEERAIVQSLALSTVVLVALTMWWAPSRGAAGAAWATLCAEAAQALVLISLDLRRHQILIGLLTFEGLRE